MFFVSILGIGDWSQHSAHNAPQHGLRRLGEPAGLLPHLLYGDNAAHVRRHYRSITDRK